MPNLGPAVSDPALLAQLNGQPAAGPSLGPAVTDPDLLKQLNTETGSIPVARDTLDNIADVGKGVLKGVATGVQSLAGLPGDAEHGVQWLLDKVMPNPYNVQGHRQSFPTTEDIDKYVPVSKLPDAESDIGKHVQNVSEFIPGALGGGESLVKSILARGVVPGVLSDAAGTATQGTAAEPYARMAGALISPSTAEKKVVPAAQDLIDAGGQGFNTFRQMPFAVKPQTMDTWASKTISDLGARNFDEDTAPKTIAVLNKHVNSSAPFVTAQDMDKTKMLLRDAQASGGNDATAATAALKSLDERVTSFTPGQTLAGDPALAAKTWNDANGNYAAGMRADAFDKATKSANDVAFAANSGAGSGNKLRGTVAHYINNDGKMRGVNADEEAAMTKMARGTFAQNMIRAASNKLGGGGGIGQSGIMSIGGELGAVSGEDTGNGLLLPALAGATTAFLAGKLSRAAYNRSVNKASTNISEMLRSRSPMANAVPNPVQPTVSPAVARLLAMHAASLQGQQPQ